MAHAVPPLDATMTALRPLCVDLDGTLVKCDTLVDSLLVLVRTRPALLLKLPGPLLRGKAAFKAYVAESVALDVVHLPYHRKLLQFLQDEHRKGRPIYLATGANEALARRVAEHLNLFVDVLGSDGAVNLTGSRKLESIRRRLGPGEFDYIGNDIPDLPLLEEATEAMVANPNLRLRWMMRTRGVRPTRNFEERGGTLRSIISAMRPPQWTKNLLVFVPLLLAHGFSTGQPTAALVMAALAAFCCFCLTASSAYIVEDLLDIEIDRRHPRKRLRPFASGDIFALTGMLLAAALLALAFTAAWILLPVAFSGWLLFYLAFALAYSFYIKRMALVNALALSGLYTLPMVAGGAATDIPISPWLAGFVILLFFSLGIAKRLVVTRQTEQ